MTNSTFRTRSPLRKVSAKRAAEDKLYWPLKKKFLTKHPICQFPRCLNTPVDVHHVKGRYGKNYLDTTTWKALCRQHHDFTHQNPDKARTMGLLK